MRRQTELHNIRFAVTLLSDKKKGFPHIKIIKKTKARTYSVSFLSDKKCKAMREYFSWGQKDKLARRRNLLAPWSLFVRQNIHSTRGIDDDVDDVDDEYSDEFDLDDNN